MITKNDLAQWLKSKKPVAKKRGCTVFVTPKYFVNNRRLLVHPSFTSRITQAYQKELAPGDVAGINGFYVDKVMSHESIIAQCEIGGIGNLCKHTVVPSQIAAMINLQCKGAHGRLTTDGVNSFYVIGKDGEIFVVYVSWLPKKKGKWGVFVAEFIQEAVLFAGDRVFLA
ncbi:MAG: hypothetical protein WAV09_04820 [Minisyncoccia bacterium]